MTLRHCAFSGCSKTVEHDDANPRRPEGWRYIWTSGDDPRIGPLQEGWYCAVHSDEMDRRVKGAHQLLPGRRRR
jgi:hypothetical protein